MKAQSINIFNQTDKKEGACSYYGFQLAAIDLIDQLKNDIDLAESVRTEPPIIVDIASAKDAIKEMKRLLEVEYIDFYNNDNFDKIISLQNDQRPTELKLEKNAYKYKINYKACCQIADLLNYIDPELHENPNDKRAQEAAYKFFKAKTYYYEDKNKHYEDGIICVMWKLLHTIDNAMHAMDSVDGISACAAKKRARSFSGHVNFETYLKSLYAQYKIKSIYYPEFMDGYEKSYYVVSELVNKGTEMMTYTYHNHIGATIEVLTPVRESLELAYDTGKLQHPVTLAAELERHIEKLLGLAINACNIKKAIALEAAEFLMILYEQLLGKAYLSSSAGKFHPLIKRCITSATVNAPLEHYFLENKTKIHRKN